MRGILLLAAAAFPFGAVAAIAAIDAETIDSSRQPHHAAAAAAAAAAAVAAAGWVGLGVSLNL